MPQEFQVLQCYSCKTFQVHQVKKTLKWACKLCGDKQSVIKVYGRGTGADCRQHVQRLNTMRGELDDTKSHARGTRDLAPAESDGLYTASDPQAYSPKEPSGKWDAFIEADSSEKLEEEDDNADCSETQYTTDASLFKTRKRKSYGRDPGSRKQARFDRFSKRNIENSQNSRSGQSIFTEEHKTSPQKSLNNLDNYGSSDFVTNQVTYKRQSRQGTSSNIGARTDGGTSNSKWGMFISNQPPPEENSSGEDNSDNIQYNSTLLESQKVKYIANEYPISNEENEAINAKKFSNSSKWNMFLSDKVIASSCESIDDKDPMGGGVSVIPTRNNGKANNMPKINSKWGKLLGVSSAESVPEHSTGSPKKTERTDILPEGNMGVATSTKDINCAVNTQSIFSLGDLSDDDLAF